MKKYYKHTIVSHPTALLPSFVERGWGRGIKKTRGQTRTNTEKHVFYPCQSESVSPVCEISIRLNLN